jgi:uncharacterized protein (UPF0261 family)
MIDVDGQPFNDPEADAALFEELRQVGGGVELFELEMNINEPEFAHAMVTKLDEYMKAVGGPKQPARPAAQGEASS